MKKSSRRFGAVSRPVLASGDIQINEAFGQAEWNAGKGQVGRIGISLGRKS